MFSTLFITLINLKYLILNIGKMYVLKVNIIFVRVTIEFMKFVIDKRKIKITEKIPKHIICLYDILYFINLMILSIK